jgi:hypothetical protein
LIWALLPGWWGEVEWFGFFPDRYAFSNVENSHDFVRVWATTLPSLIFVLLLCGLLLFGTFNLSLQNECSSQLVYVDKFSRISRQQDELTNIIPGLYDLDIGKVTTLLK